MHAEVGDDVVVMGRRVADQDRRGTIIEIRGQGRTPPYLVRWQDRHESLFYPSSDTRVEHHPHPAAVTGCPARR